MFLFDIFRSFLPSHNPIGFGASDFLELFLAVVIGLFAIFSIPIVKPFVLWLAPKTRSCLVLFAVLPVVLRLLLLPHHPVPTPNIADEFSHLLVADTLLHFRLANATHPMHRFFETFFVLQQPTYSSIYPIGQGVMLAVGKALFGLPWAGVVLSTAAFCSLSYWMLRGWTSSVWALAGGTLAVIQFGPLCLWMNDYWGGSLAAAAGCLVFGALPRLRDRPTWQSGLALGAGLAIHLLTRPFESLFLLASIFLFFIPALRSKTQIARLSKPALVAFAAMVPALTIFALQNRAVTGNWTTFPYSLSQNQYGVPISLTFQPNPVPHNVLTPQQRIEYDIQVSFKPPRGETASSYFGRLEYRVHFLRFFFLPPLYLALLAWAFDYRGNGYPWVMATLVIFSLGLNFFPAFQFHYFAAVTCLFLLISVQGLQRIAQLVVRGFPSGQEAARWLLVLCLVQFVFWYTLHLLETQDFAASLLAYETWDVINHENPERRIAVERQLAVDSAKKLVFVRYYPNHTAQEEWVWNAADIDHSATVWARDLGPEENAKLQRYFPDRHALLLEPDFRPLPKLTPYHADQTAPTPPPSTVSPFEVP